MSPPGDWSDALPFLLSLSLLSFAFGYLLGSIPFGLLLAKLAGLGDLRQIGSGNIGATNVLRTGNKGLAALTLVLDLLKGTAAVWVGSHFGPYGAMLGGLGAFLGHLFPVWLGFRGGKGVATYIGVLLGLGRAFLEREVAVLPPDDIPDVLASEREAGVEVGIQQPRNDGRRRDVLGEFPGFPGR